MKMRSGVLIITAMILAACGGDITGPTKEMRSSTKKSVLVGGNQVVIITNNKWDLCEDIGQETSYCPGAWMKVRWNGQAPDGSRTSFQMDIVWSPGCTWNIPMGPGLCIGQHLEVTFYNEHRFRDHKLLIRKYVLHLD
mgnify:CR=1 FL=1